MKNKEKDVLQKPIEQFNIRCEHGTKVYEDILTEWLNESSYFPLGCQKIESQSDGENDMRSGDYELDYKLFMSQSEGTFRGKLDSYKTPTEFNALLYLIETWDFEKDSVSDSQLLDKSAQRDMNNLIDITTKEKNLFFFIPYKYKNINPLEMLIILNAKLKSWLQYRNKRCPNHDTFVSWVHLIEDTEDDYTWDEKGNLQKVNMQFVFAKYSTETKRLDMIDCIKIQKKHIFVDTPKHNINISYLLWPQQNSCIKLKAVACATAFFVIILICQEKIFEPQFHSNFAQFVLCITQQKFFSCSYS